jgi:stress response protein YsnF
MPKAVVAMFDSRADAERAAEALMGAGFAPGEVEVRSSGSQVSAERESTSWWDWLFGESEDRNYYTEGMARGGAVLTVMTSDELAERAHSVLEAYGGDVEPARPTTTGIADTATTEVGRGRDEEVIPIVEERLKVGKRPLARTVRVYRSVTEQPVEEDVRLRDERVRLERRPTDRPLEASDDAFRDRVFEVTETAEEVVIGKEARVVEEVVIGREVDERVETVRDTVRRTDVDLEGAGRGDEDFRHHWAANFQSVGGARYDDYAPAYGYGGQLCGDPRYAGRDWASVEPEARRDWEERNPGTWDRFKDAVRYAWDKGRGTARRAA